MLGAPPLPAAGDSAATDDNADYLKLMGAYVLLLAQATEEQTIELDVTPGVETADDADAMRIEEYDHYEYYEDEEDDNSVGNSSASSDRGPFVAELLKVLNPFEWLKSGRNASGSENVAEETIFIEELPGPPGAADAAFAPDTDHYREGRDYQADESTG